jgi:hypothetical protein
LNNVGTVKTSGTFEDGLSAFCVIEIAMSLWRPGAEFYSLNMKCPPQAHVLSTWSPDVGAILGDSGNLGRWGLVGGSRSLGV